MTIFYSYGRLPEGTHLHSLASKHGVLERPHVHAGRCSTVFFAIASSDSQGAQGESI